MARQAFTLRFSSIECERCGMTRQSGVPCPDCGKAPEPTEVDVHVQHRAKVVAAARDALTRKPEDPSYGLADLVDDVLPGFLERSMAAATRVAEQRDDGERRLVAAAEEAARLQLWADSVVPMRPTAAIAKSARTAARAVVSAFEGALRGLAAERIDAAQEAERELNRSIDEGGEAVATARALLARIERVASNEDVIGGWIAESVGDDPLATAVEGQRLFEDRTGRACSSGTGFLAGLMQVVSETVGDPERLWLLVNDHIGVLEHGRERLADVVAEPLLHQRAAEVTHDLWAAARRAVVEPDPVTVRESATDLLELGHLILEQDVKFHLGVAWAVTLHKTFAASQAQDISALTAVGEGKGWAVATTVGAVDYRNAFAHRDYSVTPHDTVLLSPAARGEHAVTVTVEEALDAVLSYVETGQAMQLALFAVIEGVDVGHDSLLPLTTIVESTLAGLGWSKPNVTVDGAVVEVEGTVDRRVRMGEVAFVVQPFIGKAETVSIRLRNTRTSSTTTMRIAVAPFAQWSQAEGVAKEAAFLVVLRNTVRNGEPLVTEDHARKHAAFRSCQDATNQQIPWRDMNANLTEWRRLAKRLKLRDTEDAIARLQAFRRNVELGLPADPSDADPALQMAAMEVELLPDYLT